MPARVFVLRPEPGLSTTVARGRDAGLDMVAMPLSHAEPLAWQVPAGDFDGILLGSANGLRHAGAGLSALAHLPIYAVGRATAEVARRLGFTVAHMGEGGLQVLIDMLPGDAPRRMLRLCGDEHLPLVAPPQIEIEEVETYRIVHHMLSSKDTANLAAGGVALLHSGAAAAHFERECLRTKLDFSTLAVAALAPRIAASLSEGWKSVRVSTSPDDGALLSLAQDMCN